MTSQFEWDDAHIHAYVDGVLDEATAARLEAESRTDLALGARIARQRKLRERLRAEFDHVLEEPIPERLLDALAAPAAGAAVTPIGVARKSAARAARPVWSLREWGAVAATLVLGVFLGQTVFRSSRDLPIESDGGRLVAAGDLDTVLSTELSGAAPTSALVRIGLSFRAADGEYCRTFAFDVGAGVACRRDGRWSVEVLDRTGASAGGAETFRQASSALSPAMLEAIMALGAGEPLSLEEEQQHIGSGWDASDPR